MKKKLVIGSRGSDLALWQANHVAARLAELGYETGIEIIKTTGDKIRDVPLAQLGADQNMKGVFTKEIEEALLAGTVDLAVHSLKDLPTELPPGLVVGCTPGRADSRDALVGKTLDEIGPGDRIGTSSLRRAAQLRALKPEAEILDIRGNVGTRLKKLDDGGYDAIVLASAGLARLGLEDRIAERLDPEKMAPAVGQGALAVEIREGDEEVAAALAGLDDPEAKRTVAAERSLLDALGGGCQVPLGAYAVLEGEYVRLRATVVAPDGSTLIRADTAGDDPEEVGRITAKALLEEGAADLIAAAG